MENEKQDGGQPATLVYLQTAAVCALILLGAFGLNDIIHGNVQSAQKFQGVPVPVIFVAVSAGLLLMMIVLNVWSTYSEKIKKRLVQETLEKANQKGQQENQDIAEKTPRIIRVIDRNASGQQTKCPACESTMISPVKKPDLDHAPPWIIRAGTPAGVKKKLFVCNECGNEFEINGEPEKNGNDSQDSGSTAG